jgi:predicted secreted protein
VQLGQDGVAFVEGVSQLGQFGGAFVIGALQFGALHTQSITFSAGLPHQGLFLFVGVVQGGLQGQHGGRSAGE